MSVAARTAPVFLNSVPTDLFIAGKWRPSSTGDRIDVIDPSSETVIASVADAAIEDAIAAIDAAQAAARDWALTPARQRGEILRKAFDLMMACADDFVYLIALENGKSLADAKGEVTYAAEFFRWYSEEAVRIGPIALRIAAA